MVLETEVVGQTSESTSTGNNFNYPPIVQVTDFEREAAELIDPLLPSFFVDEHFGDYESGIEKCTKLLFERGLAQKYELNEEEVKRAITGFFAIYRIQNHPMGDPERRNKSNNHWKKLMREGRQSPDY